MSVDLHYSHNNIVRYDSVYVSQLPSELYEFEAKSQRSKSNILISEPT